jgi:hypothetical protein
MFVAFHADAYFSVGSEVLSYFTMWVEVIEIQIWFEFKLVWNLEKIWKLKSLFQFSIGHGPNSTQLAQPGLPSLSCMRPVSRPSEAHRLPQCTPQSARAHYRVFPWPIIDPLATRYPLPTRTRVCPWVDSPPSQFFHDLHDLKSDNKSNR